MSNYKAIGPRVIYEEVKQATESKLTGIQKSKVKEIKVISWGTNPVDGTEYPYLGTKAFIPSGVEGLPLGEGRFVLERGNIVAVEK